MCKELHLFSCKSFHKVKVNFHVWFPLLIRFTFILYASYCSREITCFLEIMIMLDIVLKTFMLCSVYGIDSFY